MNFDITKKQEDFISKVDSVCKSLRSIEEECYIEDRLNEKLVPEFSKIGMLGCPISKKYGGLGFDDNDHVIQLQCSWDGTNYAKSNCSTESPETR